MGGRIVSFATANGKAWLSMLEDDQIVRIVAAEGLGAKVPPKDIGPKALRTVAALMRDLAVVRSRGYALADEEAEPGVAAIAVPVLDPASGRALGTASIAGPIVRMPARRHGQLAKVLQSATLDLARAWPGTLPRLRAQRAN